MATTKTILSTTVYGEPSGNYDGSSQDWSSDSVEAADYYRGHGGLQTVTFNFEDFVGIMHVEATLDPDFDSAAWFETYVLGDDSVALNGIYSTSILGNFVWMRVRVELFDAGTINSVTITY